MELDILFADNHVLVINKQAGVLAQPDITGAPDILSLAKQYVKEAYHKPGRVYLGLVHRLDRVVSGVMVLARTSKAASRLSACFREHRALKKYLAIVPGRWSGSGTYEDFILKQGRSVSLVTMQHPKARPASLVWEALAQQNDTTLLSIELKTGRPHQIRVQLAHRGFPILGDRRYGSTRKFAGDAIALHCYVLGIHHPVTRQFMVWTAPPPRSWKGYFDKIIHALMIEARALASG